MARLCPAGLLSSESRFGPHLPLSGSATPITPTHPLVFPCLSLSFALPALLHVRCPVPFALLQRSASVSVCAALCPCASVSVCLSVCLCLGLCSKTNVDKKRRDGMLHAEETIVDTRWVAEDDFARPYFQLTD